MLFLPFCSRFSLAFNTIAEAVAQALALRKNLSIRQFKLLLQHQCCGLRKGRAMSSKRLWSSLRVPAAMLMILSLTGLATQAHAVQYRVSRPADVSRILPIDAGASAALVVEVENIEPQAGVAPVTALMVESGTTINGYVFGPGQPLQCGAPTSTANADGKLLTFPVSLAASQILRCTYPLNRATTSLDDLLLRFCSPGSVSCSSSSTIYFAGTLPDLRMAGEVASVPYGATEAIVRISQHNPTSRAVAAHAAETACLQVSVFAPPESFGPFALENDFAGACPGLMTMPCGTGFPGFTGRKRQFMLGPIPANGEASCLLKLRFHTPLIASAQQSVVGGPPPVRFVDGGTGFDLSAVNDQTVFDAVPIAAPVPATGWASLCGLAALLAMLAMTALRRRFATQPFGEHAG